MSDLSLNFHPAATEAQIVFALISPGDCGGKYPSRVSYGISFASWSVLMLGRNLINDGEKIPWQVSPEAKLFADSSDTHPRFCYSRGLEVEWISYAFAD